jgi:PKD repeat protein
MKKLLLLLLLLPLFVNAQTRLRFINFGPQANPGEGDDNYIQSIHFKLPAGYKGTAYVRIFDAACGSSLDERIGTWDSKFRFSLYKGEVPEDSLLSNGDFKARIQSSLIKQIEVGNDKKYLERWALLAGVPNDSGSVYTLVSQGIEGHDGNVFELFISSDPSQNRTIDNVKVYSYEPTIQLAKNPMKVSFITKPGKNDDEINVHTFDFDGTKIALSTLLRDGIPLKENDPQNWSSIKVPLSKYEKGNLCALDFGPEMHSINDITFYFTDKQGKKLPVQLPFYNKVPATIPDVIKQIKQTDCYSAELDFSGTNSPENYGLIFNWPDGPAAKCNGDICRQEFPGPGKYNEEVLVEEQSNAITRAKLEPYEVNILPKPKADAGPDLVRALNEQVQFDGSKSIVNNPILTKYTWSFGDGETGSGIKVLHTYKNPGKYTIVLAVEETTKQVCNLDTTSISIFINMQPVAKTKERLTAPPDQSLTFDASPSFDPDGNIVQYIWDFGMLGKKEGKIVTQSFPETGSYRVKLTVKDNTDASNNTSSAFVNVVIHNQPVPNPGSNRVVATDENLLFDGSKSTTVGYKINDFEWNFGDGTTASGIKVYHSYPKYGKYIVTLKVKDNSETVTDTNIDSVEITVNEQPVAKIVNDQYLNNGYAVFDGSKSYDVDGTITRYIWDFGDGYTDEGKTVSHTYRTAGAYTVTLQVYDNTEAKNNSAYDTSKVIIDRRPVADIGPDQVVAPGQQVSFSSSRSVDPDGRALKSRWFVDNKFISEGRRFEYAFKEPGTYTVGLEVTDDFVKPLSSVDYAKVIVNSPPVPKIEYTAIAVPNQKLRFDASKSYDVDGTIKFYSWIFSDGMMKTGKVVERLFNKSGLYSAVLTVTDNAGVANSNVPDTIYIKINTPPVIKTQEFIESCNKIITFDATASYDPDGDQLSYSWTFPDQKDIQGSGIITHNFKEYGVFPVTLTVSDGLNLSNSSVKKNITIKIHRPPVADAGVDTTVCAGDIVILNGLKSRSFDNTQLDYLWTFDDSSHLSGSSVFKVFKTGGAHKVTLMVTDNSGLACSSAITTKLLNVIEAPIANAGSDTIICANSQIKFDGSKSTAAGGTIASYDWDFGDGETGAGARPVHTYYKTGKYKVTLTITGNEKGSCDNTSLDKITVTVVDAPSASFASRDSVPQNSLQVFDASSSSTGVGNITDYNWNFGDSSYAKGKVVNHTYSKSGNFTITLKIQTDSKNECSSALYSKAVYVNAPPVAKIGSVQTAAVYQPVSFDGNKSFDPDGSISRYIWDFGDGSTGRGISVLHSYSIKGKYRVILTVTDNTNVENNSARDTIYINVYDEPSTIFTLPEYLFVNEQIDLDGSKSSNPGGESDFEWYVNDVKVSNEAEFKTIFHRAGLNKIRLVVKDKLNTQSSVGESVKYLKVINYPECSIPKSINVCAGEMFTINPIIQTEFKDAEFKYKWSGKNGLFNSDSRILNHSVQKSGKYTYYFILSDGMNNIFYNDSTLIYAVEPPQIPEMQDSVVYINSANDEVKFDASNVADADGNLLKIVWKFGDGESSALPIVFHKYKQEGIYKVELLVDDQTGTACGKVKKSFNLTVKVRE